MITKRMLAARSLLSASRKLVQPSTQLRHLSSQNLILEIRKFKQTKGSKEREKNLETLTQALFQEIISRPLDQPIFLQSVEEVITSLKPFLLRNPKYLEILPLLVIPENVHMFQVPWVDDTSVQRVNNGYRVQFNQALGPYKGGLRFHPSVDLSIIKFLGFEQVLKNSLTGLPIGGAKGGSDFDPKGKSNREIYKFCKSFMTKLHHYIGPDTDVPAGDIGVGGREIGYLYGQYKVLTSKFHGTITGKNVIWGGSHLRPEATGYGTVYIADCHLRSKGKSISGNRCLVSGSGNVAQYAAEKILQLGGKVLTFSDSNGAIFNKHGFNKDQLNTLIKLKDQRKRCSEMVDLYPEIVFKPNKSVWQLDCEADLAFPCATQNEIRYEDALRLVKNGCKGVFEGANMPCTNRSIKAFTEARISYIPGKAANAGGVAVSCLEMAQNSARMVWRREKVDKMLKEIMENIYREIDIASRELGQEGNYQLGANTVGFKRVADAMFQQGLVFHPDV